MKHLFFLVFAVVSLSSCNTTKIASKADGVAHIDAQIRHGVISKDLRSSEIAKVNAMSIPDRSTKGIDQQALDRRYSRKGNKHMRAYNSGQITRAQMLQAQAADFQRKQAVAGALNAFAAGMNQANAANQNALTTGYAPQQTSLPVLNGNQFHPDSLANPYGAGSPYKADGLMNPYSQYGSKYSNKSWRNSYATDAPKLYDSNGNYLGRLSTNRYDPDSTSNPYGKYGSKYSPTSINNKYGAGNPYNSSPIYVQPQGD